MEWLGRHDGATLRDGEDLTQAHLHLSVVHACRAVATGASADDLRGKAVVHQERAEQAIRQTLVKFGTDDSDQQAVRTRKLWSPVPQGRPQWSPR
jgi:hypothetical protein